MPSLLYRLFGVGKLPAAYTDLAAGPDTLFWAEGASVKATAHQLRAPGIRASRSVTMHSGAVVLTANRLLVTVGKRARVDARFGAATSSTPLSFAVNRCGIHITVDMAAVLPEATGIVNLDVRVTVPETVLAGLPHGEHTSSDIGVQPRNLTSLC